MSNIREINIEFKKDKWIITSFSCGDNGNNIDVFTIETKSNEASRMNSITTKLYEIIGKNIIKKYR